MAATNQQRLFDQCRDIARSRLGEVISAALAKVDEDLFALADKTVERDEQRVYLDAMARIREHRSGLQQRFEDCFGDLYSKKLERLQASPQADPLAHPPVILVASSSHWSRTRKSNTGS